MRAGRDLPASLAPLRHEHYRRLWLVGTVGHLGTYLQLTAGPWLMLVMTGSPLMVSLITSALFLPRLVFTVPAGMLSDRMDRRRILSAGYVLSALSAAALALATALDVLTPTVLLVLTFVLGSGAAIVKPAQLTYVPDLVPPLLRAQAITLNSASHQVARVVGPSIGGAFIAFGRADAAFFANALSFLLVLSAIRHAPDAKAQDLSGGSSRTTGVGVAPSARARSVPSLRMLDGLRHLRENPMVRDLIIITAAFTVFAVGLQAVLPNFVAQTLGLGPQGFGILYGCYGVGALFGAVTRGAASARLGGRLVAASMMLHGLSTFVIVAVPVPAVAAGMLVLAGCAWVWALTTLNAAVQIEAPAWVRGRVIAIFVLAVGMKPVGAAGVGLVAELAGLNTAVAASGLGAVLVGLWAMTIPVEDAAAARSDLTRAARSRAAAGASGTVVVPPLLAEQTEVEDVEDGRDQERGHQEHVLVTEQLHSDAAHDRRDDATDVEPREVEPRRGAP